MKPGEDPVKSLVGAFISFWFDEPTDPARVMRTNEWRDLPNSSGQLSDLVNATKQHFERLGTSPPSGMRIDVGARPWRLVITREEFGEPTAEVA